MKKQLTIKELKSLIKEEASKLHRRTILENEKKALISENWNLSGDFHDEGGWKVVSGKRDMDFSGRVNGELVKNIQTLLKHYVEGNLSGTELLARIAQDNEGFDDGIKSMYSKDKYNTHDINGNQTSSRISEQEILENEKKALQKELRTLDEQWNPDEDYVGSYFIATAPMDEPGETKVHVIDNGQYDEYSEAGWDVEGPFSKEEAELKYDGISSSNNLWNSMDRVDDGEAERAEQDYFRGGDDGMGKPQHMKDLDDYHSDKGDRESKLADVQKRKFRDSKDW